VQIGKRNKLHPFPANPAPSASCDLTRQGWHPQDPTSGGFVGVSRDLVVIEHLFQRVSGQDTLRPLLQLGWFSSA